MSTVTLFLCPPGRLRYICIITEARDLWVNRHETFLAVESTIPFWFHCPDSLVIIHLQRVNRTHAVERNREQKPLVHPGNPCGSISGVCHSRATPQRFSRPPRVRASSTTAAGRGCSILSPLEPRFLTPNDPVAGDNRKGV